MKFIAHRANLNGSDSENENTPKQIEKCIDLGYDVEVDIWFDPELNSLWIGHDKPQYNISWEWIFKKSEYLWIHCKDILTMNQFCLNQNNFNFFWHQNDDYTLTSKKYIWTYPGKKYTSKCVIVMPELTINLNDFSKPKSHNVYGICTDYVNLL